MDQYWIVNHDADTTETGFPTKRTYVKTIWQGFPAQQFAELEIVEDFCFKRFGAKVAYVQGVAPTPNWTVKICTEQEFETARPIIWGGIPTPTVRLVLGIGKNEKTTILEELLVD